MESQGGISNPKNLNFSTNSITTARGRTLRGEIDPGDLENEVDPNPTFFEGV